MVALNNVYKVRQVCSQQAQAGIMVSHWQAVIIAGTGATETQIATAFDTAFAAAIKAVMVSTALYRGTGTQRIFPPPPLLESVSTAGVGAGGVASDPLPKQVTGLVKLFTPSAGRKFRGRKYIPFPAETDNTVLGVPSAGYIANLTTLANVFKAIVVAGAGGNTATFQCVIWHRSTSTADFVVNALGAPIWATQRRRGDFGAPNVFPF